MKNIAIISPNTDAYSETFIQAHRNIKGNVFFYHNGYLPTLLENKGGLINEPKTLIGRLLWSRWDNYRARSCGLTVHEYLFSQSLVKNKIDVVFAEYGPSGVAVLKVCKKLNLELITMFHGFDASINELLKNYNERYLELFKYSKSIIVVSEMMRAKLITLGCEESKLVLNPCSPSDEFFKVEATFSEKKSFIAIGRFVDKKAPYYTILVFKKVCDVHPEAKLYFAGDGELLEVCKNLVRYYKLESNIIFLGAISPELFQSYLKSVVALIQHSITAESGNSEGTPVAVLEAGAAGIPVVSTYHSGISDVVIHNTTGLLCDEHDVDTMAKNVISLIENLEWAKELGRAARNNIIAGFTMDMHLKKIEDEVYK